MPEYVPSHEGIRVEFGKKEFMSSLKATKEFNEDETIARVSDKATRATKAYSTLQCGANEDDHILLNSDLLYVNHSCDPNTVFDLSSPDPSKWVLKALKHIKVGETLTYFYPSTEWEMDKPFDCNCGAKRCLGQIQGAAYLDRNTAAQYWLNSWIYRLMATRGNTNVATKL